MAPRRGALEEVAPSGPKRLRAEVPLVVGDSIARGVAEEGAHGGLKHGVGAQKGMCVLVASHHVAQVELLEGLGVVFEFITPVSVLSSTAMFLKCFDFLKRMKKWVFILWRVLKVLSPYAVTRP